MAVTTQRSTSREGWPLGTLQHIPQRCCRVMKCDVLSLPGGQGEPNSPLKPTPHPQRRFISFCVELWCVKADPRPPTPGWADSHPRGVKKGWWSSWLVGGGKLKCVFNDAWVVVILRHQPLRSDVWFALVRWR